MLSVVLTLIVIGVLLYIVENYLPMNAQIKRLIYIVVVICVVFWLLNIFGVMAYLNVPVPKLG